MGYSITELRDFGFEGFVPFRGWERSDILAAGEQDVEGAYVIARSERDRPEFVEECHHKPRGRVRTPEEAASRWIEGVHVLYFGKAPLRPANSQRVDGLANRLHEYHVHGFGRGSQHYGGKLIWQLANLDELLVGWKRLLPGESAALESGLIKGFELSHGARPYANTGAPLRSASPIVI